MARFPHGGEILGATPANPLLAPVLRPGRDLNRQQALLDLQAIQRIPGLAGYWPADPAYLWEDSAGTIPASVGGVVGRVNALGAPAPIYGPELVDTANDASIWYPAGTNTIEQDGDAVKITYVDNVGSNFVNMALSSGLNVNLTAGLVYDLSFQAKVNTGSATWNYATQGKIGAGTITATDYVTVSQPFVCAGANNAFGILNLGAGEIAWVKGISVRQITNPGLYALQATTANKPYLRKTPTSNVNWLDSNTSTSALTATLGNLGSSCTVARAGAEGVTFTEGVTISSTYNIAPAFGFNGDIAIFNRSLTATEKALLTRYMQRGVPVLGPERLADTELDNAASWTVGTNWAVSGGAATKTAGSAGTLLQSFTPIADSFMSITGAITVTAGAFNFYVGGSKAAPSITASTSARYTVGQATGSNIGVNGNAASAGTLDNLSFREIL